MIEENNELLNEVEFLKRNIKITKINEYEVENQQLREHAMRMDQVLQRLKQQIQNGTYAQAQPSLLGIQQQAQQQNYSSQHEDEPRMQSTMSQAAVTVSATELYTNYSSTQQIPVKRGGRRRKKSAAKSEASLDSNGDPKPKRRLESRQIMESEAKVRSMLD